MYETLINNGESKDVRYRFNNDFYMVNGEDDIIYSPTSVYDHLITTITINSEESQTPTPTSTPKELLPTINAFKNELPQANELLLHLVNTVRPRINGLNLPQSVSEYNNVLTLCNSIKTDMGVKFNKPRVLFCSQDGTVVVDTGKSTNTFENYTGKSVNENHNSRVAIMFAQLSLFGAGLGVENKYSGSINTNQLYAATIVNGTRFSNSGTFRISFEE